MEFTLRQQLAPNPEPGLIAVPVVISSRDGTDSSRPTGPRLSLAYWPARRYQTPLPKLRFAPTSCR
jgi:hypothetical protein